MRPIGWQGLFDDAPASVLRAPAPRDVSVIFIQQHFAAAKALGRSSKGGIDLCAATEALDRNACSRAVAHLLGAVPELAPCDRSEDGAPWVTVPLLEPSIIKTARAVWRLEDRLVVGADIAGIHLGEQSEDTFEVALDRADVWWLARAMASAQRWHEAIPRLCASCHVDVNRNEHLDTCGSEPRPWC